MSEGILDGNEVLTGIDLAKWLLEQDEQGDTHPGIGGA